MTISISTAVFICFAAILTLQINLASGKNVICYATNWPQYRPGQGKFHMSDVDPSKCTHMVFAFAKVMDNKLAAYEENDPGENGQYRQFTNLKQQFPHVKALLGVGGWTHGGEPFSTMAATPAGRSEFVTTTVQYLRRYNFDGLDIDWEYPEANDKANLVSLLQEMREAFDAESAEDGSPLLLAMAVAAGLQNAVPAYDVPALNRYLDFISVMTYDYHGAWENNTGLLAPIRAPPGDDFSLTVSMNWYTDQGASRDKLYVGMALYGRTWTLANPGDTTIGSLATGPGPTGRFTQEPGVLSHYEVCERIRNGYTTVLDPMGQTNYAYSDNEWITFEDVSTLNIKTQFILENDYAGAMVWSFDQDDFAGQFCNQGPYPLMSALADRLLSASAAASQGPTRARPNPFQQPRPQGNLPDAQAGSPARPLRRPQPHPLPVLPTPPIRRPQPSFTRPGAQRIPAGGSQPRFEPGRETPPLRYNLPLYRPAGPSYQDYPRGNPQASTQSQRFRERERLPLRPGSLTPSQPARPPYFHPERQPSAPRPRPYFSPQRFAQRHQASAVCEPVLTGNARDSEAFRDGQRFACDFGNGKFAHPSSCEHYYFCLYGVSFTSKCPLFSHFNPGTKNCECIATSSFICPHRYSPPAGATP